MARLLIASPHRYPDLARLWHRFVMRELVPGFAGLGLTVEVNIFCDASADQFLPYLFPEVRFTRSGPGMRDFMEFYDATLHAPCDFLLFLDADTFILDGDWACSHFEAFDDPSVASVSFVPRRKHPQSLRCYAESRAIAALPSPALACRYEFPENWPHGVNLQPGDFAARELAKTGKVIVNIAAARRPGSTPSTFGVRPAFGPPVSTPRGRPVSRSFCSSSAKSPAYLVAAYDNVLLGCLYESLYHEPFAPDPQGRPLGGSLTIADVETNSERSPRR